MKQLSLSLPLFQPPAAAQPRCYRSRVLTGPLLQEVMESTQGDLSIVQERCLMLQRRNEALTRELQAVKASGWSALRDAKGKTTTIAEMSAQQKELEQQISFCQQRLAERCAVALTFAYPSRAHL
jgi:hypothetical protein